MHDFRINFTESLFLVILIIVVAFSTTYSYFAAIITSQQSETSFSGSAADFSLTFGNHETNSIIVGEKITPGWQDIKTFTVTGLNKNDKNRSVYYDILMVVLENDFPFGEFKYELQGTGTGSVNVAESPILKDLTDGRFSLLTGDKAYFLNNSENAQHDYVLTIKYINTDTPQYAEDLKFSAYIVLDSVTQFSRDDNYNIG